MSRTITVILILALVAPLAGAAPADRKPVELPPPLAKLLTDAQGELAGGRPAKAIELLMAFKGKDDHALRHLILGHAYLRQDKLAAAGGSYGKALEMDSTLVEAGIALAQVLGRQGKWAEAAKLLGRYIVVDSCPADVLLLYAQVARRVDDTRLCTLLVRKGIIRFPDDLDFRRLDLAMHAAVGDHAAMRETVLLLLGKTPGKCTLWQHLAFAHRQTGDEVGALAALEVAVLCDPSDTTAQKRLLAAHLAGGDWLTAIKRGRALLAGVHGKAVAADVSVMDLLIRAADTGQEDGLLVKWLARVPRETRTRAMRLAAAKLALRQSKPTEARAALDRLIRSGETNPSVFVWAAHLAELAKDWSRAQALYDQARRGTGPAARTAVLYQARLHFKRERFGQATELLDGYLKSHPVDAPARALLAVIKARCPGK